jgi:hypothetical protein
MTSCCTSMKAIIAGRGTGLARAAWTDSCRISPRPALDDHADAPDGTRIYDNQTALILRTRWGKIVEQHDFYADTGRVAAADRTLTELGIAPVPKP